MNLRLQRSAKKTIAAERPAVDSSQDSVVLVPFLDSYFISDMQSHHTQLQGIQFEALGHVSSCPMRQYTAFDVLAVFQWITYLL